MSFRKLTEPLQALICSYLDTFDCAHVSLVSKNPVLGTINHPIYVPALGILPDEVSDSEPDEEDFKVGKEFAKQEGFTSKHKYQKMMATEHNRKPKYTFEFFIENGKLHFHVFRGKITLKSQPMSAHGDIKELEESLRKQLGNGFPFSIPAKFMPCDLQINYDIRTENEKQYADGIKIAKKLTDAGVKKILVTDKHGCMDVEEIEDIIGIGSHINFSQVLDIDFDEDRNYAVIPENVKILEVGFVLYKSLKISHVLEKLTIRAFPLAPMHMKLPDCRVLELGNVCYSDGRQNSFSVLGAGCPNLEELTIDYDDDENPLSVEFDSVLPKLRKLTITGHVPIISIGKNSIRHLILKGNSRIPNLELFPELETLEVDHFSYILPLKLKELIITKGLSDTVVDAECDLILSRGMVTLKAKPPKLLSTLNQFKYE